MATAIADNQVARAVPFLPRVQGIRSNLDDVLLRGGKLREQLGGAALIDGTLIRKIGGATELKLEIEDPGGRFLNSGVLDQDYDVALDGLGFRSVGFEQESSLDPLTLVHEALVVAQLRELLGPHTAYRDQMTRAQFAKARVYELPPHERPRFICPELDVVQPVKNDREARKRKQESKETRGHGIGDGEHLETKEGEKADQAQLELGDTALRVAEGLHAPVVVMVALIAALIDETLMGKLSANVLEAEGAGVGAEIAGAVKEITNFLTGQGGYIEGGAIAYANHNPDAGPAEIATAVQGNRDGAAPYEQCVPSARKWVEAYGASGSGSLSEIQFERYPFKQPKKENNWACITRLAGDVNWRCFESAGWIYYIAEPDLLASHRRMYIGDSTPGIIDTSIKGAKGRKNDEVSIEALVEQWAAPPGSAVELEDHGPADGTYLVDSIETNLRNEDTPARIQLKRPTKAKKEPSPPTKTRSVSFGGSGADDESAPASAPPAIGKMIGEVDATDGTFTYQWGGGHESVAALAQRLKGYDCSGYVSHILWAGGLLSSPEASGALESFGEAGEGQYCTIYANAVHAFGKLLTKSGWRYFESGGQANATGWVNEGEQDPLGGYTARHPKGM